ncbi:MAG: PQQ-dependent sugar dehydrogenase [Deltaproteobacteria bacterium]|nr:PQQ-dependent sugar dehydrogenase [Deltaproteobacteria bacterium]
MSARSLVLACVLAFAAVAACGDDDPAGPAPPTGDDAGDAGGQGDAGADASGPPWGLDTRPANTTCLAPARPPAGKVVARWTRVFAGVPLPANVVDLVKLPGAPRFYVVEREGRLLAFDATPSVSSFSVPIDLRAKVDQGFEGGFLSFALHPKFAQNGFAYVYYTRNDGALFKARLARVRSLDGGTTFDPSSEKVILEWPIGTTGTDHTGGRIVFGPDGLLYFSTGDAFTPADSQNTADAPCTSHTPCALNGKMLRIDVDKGDPYAIPPDNPFAAGGGKKEIYAWGLRNVFRFSFDRATGDLWAADVGDQRWDEIVRIERGGNYGWPRAEGNDCTDPGGCGGLVGPEHQMLNFNAPGCTDTSQCAAALVGGHVYRGSDVPELHGAYLFGDYVFGAQFALVPDPTTGALLRVPLVSEAGSPPINAVGYAEDDAGELYAIDFNGAVLRLERGGAEPSSAPPFPSKLSETGCVSKADPTKLAAGVVPYDVNVPFFSDGATKERGFAIPDGATIAIAPDGDLDLPKGSVVVKTFRLEGKPIETRLLVRHDDGEWAGYSYEWSADGKDATLLPGGKTKQVGAQDWVFPSRADCHRCHTKAAGSTLGLEIAQLARKVDYPGRPAREQVVTLEHVGLFGSKVPAVEPLPPLGGPAPIAQRARAMLHARCSHCHRPGAPSAAQMDLRFTTPLEATKICGVVPGRGDLGIPGAKLLAPGAPDKSVLAVRMRRTDAWRMPPLASRKVDEEGAALLDALAREITACP